MMWRPLLRDMLVLMGMAVCGNGFGCEGIRGEVRMGKLC